MRIACLFFLIFAILIHLSAAICGGSNGEYTWNGSNGTLPTNNTEFQENLEYLLDNLPNNDTRISLYGWQSLYNGVDPNAAYSQARCIGYVDNSTCLNCIKEATAILKFDCSTEDISAFLYHDFCMVQYSNLNIAGTMQMPDDMIFVKNISGEGGNKAPLVISILASLVIISIIIFVGIYLFLRKKDKDTTQDVEITGKTSDEDESIFVRDMKTEETLQYDFLTISAASENFSEANKLGQGGFGAVYKGKLQNGDEIAVKRLSQTSGQGEIEFTNEVTLLAKLQHRNLVKLLGFCLKKKERLLIYEFVANSSLDNFIFDPIKRVHLNWDPLYKIIIGVARGLLYLHEDSRLRIIHRDLKSSNVLLDNEMTPKIADFGMAKLFQSDETQGSTSKIVGTCGYMAPEYAMYGQFSIKSDVFSFGVLLMEIICGRRNTFFLIETSVENLLSYAWKNWEEGTIINLLDPTLRLETSSTREIMRCIHIGLLCTQEDDTQRSTMASVFNLLRNLSIALPIPSKPAFFQQCDINQGTPLLQDYDSAHISNSNGSKNKSCMSWSTDTELRTR